MKNLRADNSSGKIKAMRLCAILLAAIIGVGAGFCFFRYFSTNAFVDTSIPLVKTAALEVGTKYGEKYWSWYGFSSRVDWCACFVSWCVNENEDAYENDMESFCYVPSGVNWFVDNNQWLEGGEKPEAGDIIFFDWDESGIGDHVGIVAGYKNGLVFTIEGNSRDKCKRKVYPVNSKSILGYGKLK